MPHAASLYRAQMTAMAGQMASMEKQMAIMEKSIFRELKRLESLKRRAERTGEKMPEHIDVVRKVTANIWEAETAAFQHECELANEREYQQMIKAWELSLADSPTRTAEEIAATLENAAFYLQPFVDAIQERFGMCTSILLAGPIGIRGGKIGMQSVHAGKTKGLAPANWPKYDWQGFQDVEKSMISFARECFMSMSDNGHVIAEAECNAGGNRSSEDSSSGAEGWEFTDEARGGRPTVRAPSQSVTQGSAATSGEARGGPTLETPPMGGAASSVQTGIMQISGEREGNDNEDCETGGGHLHDELWQRNDRAEWTAELGRAHAAFERGRGWGLDWAVCVQKFYDFEAAWGFVEYLGHETVRNTPTGVLFTPYLFYTTATPVRKGLPIEGKRDGSHAACFNFEEVRGFGLPTGPPSASLGNHVGSVYTAAGA
ncbi:hypothetical protein B0H13DRAFT_1893562 [Mycena leptocephala]|nr:hypothetical protein B0H13DRAFT_1893562 [Mycena leptocephala]